MDATGLILAAGLMGLAGTPHCAAMCAAPCTAVTQGAGRAAAPLFHLGRVAGYAAAGAVAASSVGMLQQWLGVVPALRPLWTLLHLAALALGLWMLLRGRMPVWPRAAAPAAPPGAGGWQRLHGPLRSAAAGSAWIAWPCALSQSALLLAALADRPWSGAAAMGLFAVASSPGLLLGPVVLRRISVAGGSAAAATWPVRAAGFTLVAASGWALGHGLWAHVAALCA